MFPPYCRTDSLPNSILAAQIGFDGKGRGERGNNVRSRHMWKFIWEEFNMINHIIKCISYEIFKELMEHYLKEEEGLGEEIVCIN